MEEVASEKPLSSPLRCWWKASYLICWLWQSPEWGLDFVGCQPFLVFKGTDNLSQVINRCHYLPWSVRLFKKKLPGGDSSLGCNLDHTQLTFSERRLWRWQSSFQMFTAHVPQAMKKQVEKGCPIFLCHYFWFFWYQYPSIFFPPLYIGKVELPLVWSHHLGWSFKILGVQEKPISILSCIRVIILVVSELWD